ncbi:MAG: UDP binding domain-containing protein [Candidatus Diapherotrites archaeon]|nr:UDP binding domain-containing protein [Candidatus Diapherotrites archaeon]
MAFKPDTDDMRFAPSIDIVNELLREGAKVKAFDPEAMERAKAILPGIEYCNGMYEVAKGADALLFLTEWGEFKEIDFNKVKELMKQPVVCDGRNMFDPAKLRQLGFNYVSIGRL